MFDYLRDLDLEEYFEERLHFVSINNALLYLWTQDGTDD